VDGARHELFAAAALTFDEDGERRPRRPDDRLAERACDCALTEQVAPDCWRRFRRNGLDEGAHVRRQREARGAEGARCRVRDNGGAEQPAASDRGNQFARASDWLARFLRLPLRVDSDRLSCSQGLCRRRGPIAPGFTGRREQATVSRGDNSG
jgi:hypothetical protein